MSPAAQAARNVRRARRRAARERQSLGDALYAVYVVVLFSAYPLSALGAQAAPRPGALRSAAAGVEPVLVLGVALAVVAGRAAAAVRGGPVVLPPEDARLLVTWPVPRRSLVLPALAAALVRSLAAAALASAILLYVDVRDLGAPAAVVLRDDLALPALIALVTVLAAWLVQVSPVLAVGARVTGGLLALTGLAGVCWFGRRVALDGYLGALQDLADRVPTGLPFSGAVAGQASTYGLPVALLLVAALVPLTALSVRAAARATPEQLLARSRRADVTRTGLKLGFTSSVYLSRTEPLRRARRRRVSLPQRAGHVPALVGKAFVQEQGTPVAARLLACGTVVGLTLAAASRVTPGRGFAVTLVWAALLAAGLGAVATRFADPVRLDVDRAPVSGAIPVRHLRLARIDLAVSSGLAATGALLGAAGVVLLGLTPAAKLPELGVAAVAVGVLLASAGALGALSDDPSPFLPPALAIGYRTSGLIAVAAGCLLAGVALRAPTVQPPTVPPDRLPTASIALALVALVTYTVAAHRAAGSVTKGR